MIKSLFEITLENIIFIYQKSQKETFYKKPQFQARSKMLFLDQKSVFFLPNIPIFTYFLNSLTQSQTKFKLK